MVAGSIPAGVAEMEANMKTKAKGRIGSVNWTEPMEYTWCLLVPPDRPVCMGTSHGFSKTFETHAAAVLDCREMADNVLGMEIVKWDGIKR